MSALLAILAIQGCSPDQASITESYGPSLGRVIGDANGKCGKTVSDEWFACAIEEDPGSGSSMTAILWPTDDSCWKAKPIRDAPARDTQGKRLIFREQTFQGCVEDDDRDGDWSISPSQLEVPMLPRWMTREVPSTPGF